MERNLIREWMEVGMEEQILKKEFTKNVLVGEEGSGRTASLKMENEGLKLLHGSGPVEGS